MAETKIPNKVILMLHNGLKPCEIKEFLDIDYRQYINYYASQIRKKKILPAKKYERNRHLTNVIIEELKKGTKPKVIHEKYGAKYSLISFYKDKLFPKVKKEKKEKKVDEIELKINNLEDNPKEEIQEQNMVENKNLKSEHAKEDSSIDSENEQFDPHKYIMKNKHIFFRRSPLELIKKYKTKRKKNMIK